ncbi:DedA family protein [Micromonospora sp. NPDC000089]|uniref:DedA family protein n=1 Tax=unclassified Micromonospora TaxID=2617518 RepID=UPI003675361C
MTSGSLALSHRSVVATAEPASEGPVGYVTGLVERLGGPGAGLAVALENLFPPIPSEVILPLAGFAAAQGRISLLSAILWTTLGSVLGAWVLYGIGAALGRDRMRALAARLPLIKLDDVDRTEAWFLRHGVKAVFFGRMIPVFRSLISVPAGVERMRIGTFLLYTTLGSAVWNTVFVLAGYLLGANWHVVEGYVGSFQKVVIVVCAAGAGWFVVRRIRRDRRSGATGEPSSAAHRGTAGEPARAYRGTVYRGGTWPGDAERSTGQPPRPSTD